MATEKLYDQIEQEPEYHTYEVLIVNFEDETDSLVLTRTPIDSGKFSISSCPQTEVSKRLLGEVFAYGTTIGEIWERNGSDSDLYYQLKFNVVQLQYESRGVLLAEITPEVEKHKSEYDFDSREAWMANRLNYLLSEEE